jgi:hypothetical protein
MGSKTRMSNSRNSEASRIRPALLLLHQKTIREFKGVDPGLSRTSLEYFWIASILALPLAFKYVITGIIGDYLVDARGCVFIGNASKRSLWGAQRRPVTQSPIFLPQMPVPALQVPSAIGRGSRPRANGLYHADASPRRFTTQALACRVAALCDDALDTFGDQLYTRSMIICRS